ncbi:ATP-binding protein [Bacillus fungorum]|uniref:ATP-binding protein n=1 Tax=Bacillus fungorum TaxID=2039284 RepID=UPI003F54FCAC
MENELRNFPMSLLHANKESKLDYFQKCVVEHTRIQQVQEQLISYIDNPAGSSICLVLGPSGVGKTTLGASIETYFVQNMLDELNEDLCRIPIVRLELVSSDSGVFNWKDYYRRALEYLQEPLIDFKVNLDEPKLTEMEKKKRRFNYHDASSTPELRRSLENALKYRRPVAFLIDEAQHLLKVSSAKRLQDQLDAIKSLANMTNVPHILIGTYELKEFVSLSGQLSRRTAHMHFQRYRADHEEEYHTFLSVLYMFQKHLPLREEPNLIEHGELLYERTLGCIGILKDWLIRCLGDAIDNDKDTITLAMLKKHALAINALFTLFEEIEQGERLFIENEQERMDLISRIGLKSQKKISSATMKKRHSVGKRNPVRDKVGINNE